MGSSDLTLTRTTRTTIKMSVSTIISCFLFSSQFLSTFASVAVGYAKLNPDNPNECVDPDTGVGHRLGTSWSVSGCGEARCDLRHGTVYISYSYCGAVHAEDGCYLKKDVLMPYPSSSMKLLLTIMLTMRMIMIGTRYLHSMDLHFNCEIKFYLILFFIFMLKKNQFISIFFLLLFTCF